jgi:L,D-transpeptidase ErfK/SrfK
MEERRASKKWRRSFAAAVAAASIASTDPAAAGSRWTEADFRPRPLVAYPFQPSSDLAENLTVIGTPRRYQFRRGDTLYDVARHFGLGINEVQDALPDIDVWLPPEGESRHFPTWWVLPESDYQGIVINIPEMRLYYFLPRKRNEPPTVITYPVGLGRDEWQTPLGRFRVGEKTVNPTWVIPESIREERIREKGRYEKVIPGGHPDNPLGRYRIRTSLPMYGIHGTNIPWGVGMKVSHGCIRLYPEDIEQLFPLVATGTPGEIVYQPVKIGARQGRIYVEVHRAIYDEDFDYWGAARQLLRNKGWENYVDWGMLAAAIERKSGVPTRISGGFGITPSEPPPGLFQAHIPRANPRGEPPIKKD